MDCSEVVTELGAYHLDVCDAETQARVEAHLPTCPDCVRAFLAAKRALTNPAPMPRPRAEVRERLRADVARAFPAAPRRFWAAVRTPVPVYKSAAVTLAIAAAAVLVPRFFDHKPAPVVEAGPYIDAARPHAEGFTVY